MVRPIIISYQRRGEKPWSTSGGLMVGVYFVLALLVVIFLLTFDVKRALIVSMLVCAGVLTPVWFVSQVVYPPGCVAPDAGTARQAEEQTCSTMQLRIHGNPD